MNGRELAAAIMVHESTVSRIASGDRDPGIEVMGRIRDALGWSLDQQWLALKEGNYPAQFKERMERRGVRAASAAVRVA